MAIKKTNEGVKADQLEQQILKDYSYAKYNGEPLLKYNGNTELFKYDILGWDTWKIKLS